MCFNKHDLSFHLFPSVHSYKKDRVASFRLEYLQRFTSEQNGQLQMIWAANCCNADYDTLVFEVGQSPLGCQGWEVADDSSTSFKWLICLLFFSAALTGADVKSPRSYRMLMLLICRRYRRVAEAGAVAEKHIKSLGTSAWRGVGSGAIGS